MKVAIVDDDESVSKAISRLLTVAGMSPSAFASAEEFMSSRPSGLDCLLLDVHLGGGMSGPELHRWLLDQGDLTPVIYLSASDDPRAEAAARLLGCVEFIRKGDSPDSILSALARVQDGHSLASTRRTDGTAA